MQTIEIDGKEYHAYDDGTPCAYEDSDDPIPTSVCICFAHCASECGCGAWDREITEN